MYSLRVASSGGGGSTGLGFVLGRFGWKRGGGGGRSVSATSNAAAKTPGDQCVGTEQGKQQQPPGDGAGEQCNTRDDMHKTAGDVMTHSFGEGYSTRSDEEGFGGVYGGNDPVFNRGTEVHPSHPEYDASQGSEVEEEEEARQHKDDKNAT